jgi:single-strand DNA-binding protein
MSRDINNLVIIGRLTKPAEIKNVNGKLIADFSIASNNDYGQKKEVHYFNCVAFGKTVDVIQKYTDKGKQVCINGSLHQDRWQDKTNGQNRSSVKIIVNNIQLLGSKGEQNTQGDYSENQGPPDSNYVGQDPSLDNDLPY